MSFSGDKLYNLLPAIYRIHDEKLKTSLRLKAGEDAPLQALIRILAGEAARVEKNIFQLYENWFIETCQEWAVPYIGDLLDVRGLLAYPDAQVSLRSYVANTLAYRRRKGTLSVLEQFALDISGWPAKAVEFFELLAATQYMNHLRPGKGGTANLRDLDGLDLLEGPFTRTAHFADVRSISANQGRYNIPNIGLFLYRLKSYPLQRVTARRGDEDWQWYFNPLGVNQPLFNRPVTEKELTHLAEEENLPGPLRPLALFNELNRLRKGAPAESAIYFPDGAFDLTDLSLGPVFEILPANDASLPIKDMRPVATNDLYICDQSEWHQPAYGVAVDPRLGRIAFAADKVPARVETNFFSGFSGDLGGGVYTRDWTALGAPVIPETADKSWRVPSEKLFSKSVAEWNDLETKTSGLILIEDSRTHVISELLTIEIPAGASLTIRAAAGCRPHLLGNILVHADAAPSEIPGHFYLEGVLLEGSLVVSPGNLGDLIFAHCTLIPGEDLPGDSCLSLPDPSGEPGNPDLDVTVFRSILSGVSMNMGRQLSMTGCVIDKYETHKPDEEPSRSPDEAELVLSVSRGETILEACTVFGITNVRSLQASNSIFMKKVTVTRKQQGCVRFSYLPRDSATPRRYRCQPDMSIIGLEEPEQTRRANQLVPRFTSLRYGDPGYAQLHVKCANEIRTGADDGAGMGAFYFLKEPQREANLLNALDEYLRFGLEAGLIFVT